MIESHFRAFKHKRCAFRDKRLRFHAAGCEVNGGLHRFLEGMIEGSDRCEAIGRVLVKGSENDLLYLDR